MSHSQPKERILIVDDDRVFIAVIEAFLKADNFTVYRAQNGKEAFNLFKQYKPDLVMSDLYMPEMSGLELLEILQKESPETPVIVISGANDINNAISALRLGAWDYIVKPFTHPVLQQTVNRVIEKLNLVKENKRIRQELARGFDQLKADQLAGERVQKQLLPNPQLQFNNYRLTYQVIPSLYLSGDFIDYFTINENKIGFYIADVSGHGASSAFVTVMLKGIMTRMQNDYISNRDDLILYPNRVLKQISDEIFHAKLGKYITMVYCVMDKENTLCYSIGGHYPNPIVWDGHKASFLEGKGFAVGIHPNAYFDTYQCKLPDEFSLLMLSDGIFELMEGKDLESKERQLLNLFNQHQVSTETIFQSLGIKGDVVLPDDVTILLMNRAHHLNLARPI